ncbi:hypothetical protein FRC11_000261, partial [Ceratobasidium sp. 423]
CINTIGVEHISTISSDSTGNTRLACELIAKIFPWIIILPDCCHHLNNAAKDICDLECFADANQKLPHHLTAWCQILKIAKGLVVVANTWFVTLYYAIASLRPCLRIIVDLVKSGVIAVDVNHPLAWLCDKQAVRAFEDAITLEMALLEPIACSVKCLESSMVTMLNVTLYWLATQATLNDYFTDPEKRDELMLTEGIICDVHGIMNGRFAQMIQGPKHRMYTTALSLDPFYLGSSIFTRKNINPLTITITIPLIAVSPACNAPDADLRAKFPHYSISGGYLGELVIHDFNAGHAPKVFERFSSGDEILDEFRVRIASYTRQISPFDHYRDASTLEYWQQISRYPEGDIIGYLALKLLRISPSSVAEEHTVSTITKFNAPDRGRQKASTLIQMTQIRQHFQREERLLEDSKVQKPRIAPTLCFCDMSDMFKSLGKVSVDLRGVGASSATSGVNVVTATDSSAEDEDTEAPGLSAEEWECEAGFDEVIEWVEAGSKDAFEVDGINLLDPLLLDLLSDEPIPGAIT